jgi:hypothetical protein
MSQASSSPIEKQKMPSSENSCRDSKNVRTVSLPFAILTSAYYLNFDSYSMYTNSNYFRYDDMSICCVVE